MKSDVQFMLEIIAAVINERSLPDAVDNIDWNRIYSVSVLHNVTNIIGYAVMTEKYSINEQLKQLFAKAVSDDMRLDAIQAKKSEELFKRFDSEQIDYMPLKGLNVKKLYPSEDMRRMSDMDILARESQREKIASVMEELGYTFLTESDHELIYAIKPFVTVELHKRMIPSYYDDLYEYYGDGWKLAVPCESGSRYMLTPEDEFVYLFAHMAKHYRDAGIGIKHITDIWLFSKKIESLNFEYIIEQLEKLNLHVFYKNISKMMQCWFEGMEFDDISMRITEFVFNSGVFGTIKNRASTSALRDNMDKDLKNASKYKYLRMFFPGIRYMENVFPVLKKRPYLLPYYWIKRLIIGVLFKRHHISHHVSKASNVDHRYVLECSDHMKTVGLDVYSGREKK